jgi:hypothetical protein
MNLEREEIVPESVYDASIVGMVRENGSRDRLAFFVSAVVEDAIYVDSSEPLNAVRGDLHNEFRGSHMGVSRPAPHLFLGW